MAASPHRTGRAEVGGSGAVLTRPALGIYVHIPFCVAKCRYCDFVSRPLTPGALERYLEALEREITAAPEAGRGVGTVYVGGGTPSLLAPRQLARVLEAVSSVFTLADDAEVTIEANPGTLSAASACGYRDCGANRVSLGVQSLDDSLLSRAGRRHTAREALAAYDLLRGAGFGNIGLDLIRGLPGQSPGIWRRDLSRAIALGPEHLSLYGLGVEEGTPFERERRAGRLALPSEDEEAAMLAAAAELTCVAGYEHYEISNYARPGYRCRHNLDCWSLSEYRGFGATAHSFLRAPAPVRLANTADVDDYVRLAGRGRSAVALREIADSPRLAGEALMLALRTAGGIDEAAFAVAHGAPWDTLFAGAAALGEARGWIERAGGRARLSEEGMLFSDAIFRLLF